MTPKVFLFFVACVVASIPERCEPTRATDLGPAYVPFPPWKKNGRICEDSGDFSFLQSTPNHPYIMRERVSVKNKTLSVKGTVRSTVRCFPLAGAEIDVWQSSSEGQYGPLHAQDGFCRGFVKSDTLGNYAFHSQHPGSYGLCRLIHGSLSLPDCPPFGPRHFHVVVYHPRHKLGVFQLHFPNDPAREFDFRNLVKEQKRMLTSKKKKKKLAGHDIGASNENLTLHVNEAGEASFDFVLEPLDRSELDNSPKSRHEALMVSTSLFFSCIILDFSFCKGLCRTSEVPVPALCNPRVASFFRLSFVGPAFLVWNLVWLFVFVKCCCRKRKSNLGKAKRE